MDNIYENGNIKISDEVIATIATIAVSDVDGVHSLSGSFAGEIAEKLGKRAMTKGVKSSIEGDEITLDLNVVLKYGVRIPEIAWNIQENVKKSVESMTGMNVTKVNVRVVGIEIPEETVEDEPIDLEKDNISDESEQ